MCGIFGLAVSQARKVSTAEIRSYANYLFACSESRGKEASGLALRDSERITVLKQPEPASVLTRSKDYDELFKRLNGSAHGPELLSLIGHSRLVTNGIEIIEGNNQPVITDRHVGIHNGIIVNDAALWRAYPEMRRRNQVDTEVLLSLMERFDPDGSYSVDALRRAFDQIEGTASVAIYPNDTEELQLATNNGSLYLLDCRDTGLLFFASELYILQQFVKKFGDALGVSPDDAGAIRQLPPGNAMRVLLRSLEVEEFALRPAAASGQPPSKINGARKLSVETLNLAERHLPENASLRRCTRCILPETMPFIEFDADGVCNYCHDYEPLQPLGKDALLAAVEQYRRKGGEPECLVAVSGGRDSCYGLHLIVRELGLKPLAYTYDWGLITDLARRNQARLCGKLGVEHILVSADIKKKREYVRKNVEAWLRRPDLGMIPLFMAGDKQYFYYAKKVKENNRIALSFLCENRLERARFKSGFCGVYEGRRRVFNLGVHEKAKMLTYYGRQYLVNPAYINASLLDTAGAYYSSYLAKHDEHLQLFDYIRWDESTVVDTLLEDYDWELATDTKSTWRIGDGTAAFYNYIYYTVAGFTENDALRSNQIREGVLDRARALELVKEENRPRWDSLLWYASTIGFNLNDALRVINKMPRLYEQ